MLQPPNLGEVGPHGLTLEKTILPHLKATHAFRVFTHVLKGSGAGVLRMQHRRDVRPQ